ncbi:MAG: TerB family tellurite resistance protein [Rhodospirillales bacterium]|nr:TerB family tellurite resistance protein [Alphaproteobacteria bacterium]MBL6947089.1 TerB family tellurite resistance protein [Rhodospirillales bacterium]
MIDRIKALILGGGSDDGGTGGSDTGANDLRVASVALLIEAAVMDGDFDDAERQVIAGLIAERFDLEGSAIEDLIAAGEEAVEDSHQLYGFTRVIKQGFDVEDRVEMIEMLWDVACADGVVHDYEANLVRRVAGLIHVPDRDSGAARKRAMMRHNLER